MSLLKNIMEYIVNINNFNMSSILENYKGKTWSINNVYKNEFTIDSLMTTLEVVNIFKRKYPNDETIQNFEDIVREEICQIFGGTTIGID